MQVKQRMHSLDPSFGIEGTSKERPKPKTQQTTDSLSCIQVVQVLSNWIDIQHRQLQEGEEYQ